MERPVSTVGLENRESSGATLSWMNLVLGSARAFAVERRVALLEGVGSTRAKGRGVGGYVYVCTFGARVGGRPNRLQVLLSSSR